MQNSQTVSGNENAFIATKPEKIRRPDDVEASHFLVPLSDPNSLSSSVTSPQTLAQLTPCQKHQTLKPSIEAPTPAKTETKS